MTRAIAGVLILVLTVTAAALTNRSLLETRLDDIDLLLEEVSAAEEAARTIGIVVRFELIKRRLSQGEQRVENYQLEARLQALVDNPAEATREASTPRGGSLARRLSRLFRAAIGRPPVEHVGPATLSALEEAYLWERTRRYERAIAVYDQLLRSGDTGSPPMAAVLQLHKAFCLAMIGRANEARPLCEDIMETAEEEVSLIALEILRFLDFVATTRLRISDAELPAFELGRSLYYATDYAGSARVLRKFLEETNADPRSAEARYFLARCLEELGRTESSIDEYRRVMLLDPEGPWSRESNRRLVMIGSFYQNDEALSANARRRLERMGDQEFASAVEPYEDLAQTHPGAPSSADPASVRPSDRGELFIRTNPEGADLVVNGVSMGRSPLFVTDVPLGTSVIRASLGALAGEALVNVDRAEIIPVVLSLGIMPGSLRILTTLRNAEVSLDDTTIGRVDSPSLQSLSPGQYVILVRGNDRSGRIIYWEDVIQVEAGQTLTITVP